MSIRRRAAALGAVSLGLVALSACEKPTPLATVTVGQKTVTTEASAKCYSDGDALSAKVFQTCLAVAPEKTITVHAGDKVRLGVDPEIAEKGWLVAANLSQKSDLLKDKTYWNLSSDTLFFNSATQTSTKTVVLNIIGSGGGQNDYRGVWKVKLVNGDA